MCLHFIIEFIMNLLSHTEKRENFNIFDSKKVTDKL